RFIAFAADHPSGLLKIWWIIKSSIPTPDASLGYAHAATASSINTLASINYHIFKANWTSHCRKH
ncbi:MAG: hypothetical protein ACXWT4_19990, partial [Methylobacter sp.]